MYLVAEQLQRFLMCKLPTSLHTCGLYVTSASISLSHSSQRADVQDFIMTRSFLRSLVLKLRLSHSFKSEYKI